MPRAVFESFWGFSLNLGRFWDWVGNELQVMILRKRKRLRRPARRGGRRRWVEVAVVVRKQ
jgi:hypothetical protein